MNPLAEEATALLRSLIQVPSFSREEDQTAAVLQAFFEGKGLRVGRLGNNVWVASSHWQEGRPTLLLNSHHDTVKPGGTWQRDPFTPAVESGKLYGLGSNDAGGPLVALIAAFLHLEQTGKAPVNLLLAATAEEEISGTGGIEMLLPALPPIGAAIVGEPTSVQAAVAERGLLVVDGSVAGQTGHAARDEGINAIYEALPVLERLRTYTFPLVSEHLGGVKLTLTQLQAGSQHNVVPAVCKFVVDVRLPEVYTPAAVLAQLQADFPGVVWVPRSLRLRASAIPTDHPLVEAATRLGLSLYGSPTLSDMALLPFPALKLGPGDSARSHTPDEFIYLSEIEKGIACYIQLIEQLPTQWPKKYGSPPPVASTLR